ncbi:MAG: hypothetical protein HYZ01_04345 [Ignavibacteriales bacterium]|nr:hypothetical protein [Ignavibacteriales bacterium]
MFDRRLAVTPALPGPLFPALVYPLKDTYFLPIPFNKELMMPESRTKHSSKLKAIAQQFVVPAQRPIKTEYGQREVVVRDCNGFLIAFGDEE